MLKKILQTPLPKNLLPTLKHQISKQQPSPRLVLPIAKRQSFMTTFPFCTNNDKKGNNQTVDQSFKDQSKQFYDNYVEDIIQLKSTKDWEAIIPNIKEPIVLDLYADWCGPCKQLTPRLIERIQKSGKAKLVKVNIDTCPQIAQALQVKSVPTVYLLYKGQAVDGFQGNASDAELDRFFGTIGKLTGTNPEEAEAIKTIEAARDFMKDQKYEQAAEALENFKKISKEDLNALRDLFLAQCYLLINKKSKFRDTYARLATYEQFFKQIPDLQQFYKMLQAQFQKLDSTEKGDPEIIQKKQKVTEIGENPEKKQARLEAKFELASTYKQKQMTEDALIVALEIVKEDKNWSDKKANKFILETFKELGNGSAVVQKYRKLFQRLLN